MPRFSIAPTFAFTFLALGACGSDTLRTQVDGGGTPTTDASDVIPGDDGGVPGDGGVDPDGSLPLTLCQEATQHSDFAWLQANVFTPSCATAGCHVGPNAEVGLRLEAGQAYNNLVNKGTSTVQGWIRVVPGNPASSYLMVSLGRAEGPPPRDGFMPLGADALCTEIHEAIERWIEAGAPNN